jgi:hypothetical protein
VAIDICIDASRVCARVEIARPQPIIGVRCQFPGVGESFTHDGATTAKKSPAAALMR